MNDDKDRRWGSLVIWGPFNAVDASDVDRVEQVIGLPLPLEYRQFIELANGGTLEYGVRLPPGDPGGAVVGFSSLFEVQGHGGGTLLGQWQSHPSTYMAELLPAPLLPVARDGGGSMLYLDLREQTHGAVWAFVHGLPAWAGGNDRDTGGLVASSWQQYLDMLFIDEDLGRDVWENSVEGAEPEWLPSVVHWLDAGLPGWRTKEWAVSAPD